MTTIEIAVEPSQVLDLALDLAGMEGVEVVIPTSDAPVRPADAPHDMYSLDPTMWVNVVIKVAEAVTGLTTLAQALLKYRSKKDTEKAREKGKTQRIRVGKQTAPLSDLATVEQLKSFLERNRHNR